MEEPTPSSHRDTAKGGVFVTSAAGKLGSDTIHFLLSHFPGFRVRGSVRYAEKSKGKFSKLSDRGNFELLVTPNVTEEEGFRTLVEAMRGCQALFLIPPNQGRVEVGKVYARAAKEAGVEFILLLSIAAVGKRDVLLAREFAEIEDFVRGSGIRATFLRAGFFTDNLLADAATVKRGKDFYHLANPDAKFNPIAVSDISLLASSLLVKRLEAKEKMPMDNNPEIYYLTGPHPVSMTEVANIFSKIVKDDVKYIQYDRKDYLKVLAKPGKPESLAQGLLELWDMVNDGLDETISPDFEKLMGWKPISVESFLTAHPQLFV